MRIFFRFSLFLALIVLAIGAKAAPPVVFSKQLLPLLQVQCLGCHGGAHPASGYSMETRDKLISGGRHGTAILPGKGAKSNLILYMTGELKPKMPPGGAIDLEKIALIRRWIDEGAKVDTMNAALPTGQPKTGSLIVPLPNTNSQPAPVTALAYSPDGKILAAGGYRAVRLLNPATGAVTKTIPGTADQVQALAWSSDGKVLAAAGGIPGKVGEILLYDTQTWKPLRSLVGHMEVVYAIAWKPNSTELATGSLDKTACIWDSTTGKCVRVLKDHADAVFAVAYSPDGKLLATGSADRSAKLFDTTSWKRVAALTAHQDTVTHVAFHPTGTLLATVGADKQLRIWKVGTGTMENPLRTQGEGDTITTCAFSPDGSLLVWGASNHVVKVFNGDGANQMREMKEAQDWVYSVAVGSDSQTVVAGTQDGKVLFWNIKEGKLLRTVTLFPTGAKVEATK